MLYRSYYGRGEVGLLLISSDARSNSQFGYGIAVGSRYPIGDKPFDFRVETALTTWQENRAYFEATDFRVLIGLTLRVN